LQARGNARGGKNTPYTFANKLLFINLSQTVMKTISFFETCILKRESIIIPKENEKQQNQGGLPNMRTVSVA
jgi:hypothetical protein